MASSSISEPSNRCLAFGGMPILALVPRRKRLRISQDFYKLWSEACSLPLEFMCTVGWDFLPNHPS
jgi:hypothetical protein